ncbi:hypothetical protein MKS88_005268 [Plasmodium brasilianum]|uniref:Gamete antigen 27/25, putative n=3 Tax=Plasmodium (Plasmodium) TaxID=418103 RepID=A0A1D3TDV0_PLAMA|nr:gamete antigen 27/25, putative [Plasmodium malariae]KAI4834593.1 gamete antigen 27/25 [Plasmodium brasilianum]KAI4834594.1 hypothetical protein MKS88_005268 [Plasmodium brasilianum]SCP03131.1 gamete antigen 27/25, putative [Plasmodium malariae]
MNIYTFIQIQIFVIYALIKCAAGSSKNQAPSYNPQVQKTITVGDKTYQYKYDHYKSGPPREEVMKWLDVEFHASTDVLYHLLPLAKDPWKLFNEIEYSERIYDTVREYEDKYKFKFRDEEARESCVERIKGRLLYPLYLEPLTEDYCKTIQKYFWIEERLEEEMTVKMDREETYQDKKAMSKNEDEMKRLISIYEKGRSIKLSDDMIHFTISIAKVFLEDYLKLYTEVYDKLSPTNNDKTKQK